MENSRQLFVVRAPKRSATYVFNNHDAALRCRHELGLRQDSLVGCVIFDDWKDGEPTRLNSLRVKHSP